MQHSSKRQRGRQQAATSELPDISEDAVLPAMSGEWKTELSTTLINLCRPSSALFLAL